MPAHRLAPHYQRSTGPLMAVRPPHWALLAQSESQKKSRKNKLRLFHSKGGYELFHPFYHFGFMFVCQFRMTGDNPGRELEQP